MTDRYGCQLASLSKAGVASLVNEAMVDWCIQQGLCGEQMQHGRITSYRALQVSHDTMLLAMVWPACTGQGIGPATGCTDHQLGGIDHLPGRTRCRRAGMPA